LGDDSLEWKRLRRTRHVKYWCAYHFVWIPKYRRDILVDEVVEYTKELLRNILEELECEAITIKVMPDHIHVFALCPPRYSPSYIANYLKGKSARKILQKFPELKAKEGGGRLWSRSYFVATVGNVTADIIKRYIEEQGKKEATKREKD